jgi:hypothetical protein
VGSGRCRIDPGLISGGADAVQASEPVDTVMHTAVATKEQTVSAFSELALRRAKPRCGWRQGSDGVGAPAVSWISARPEPLRPIPETDTVEKTYTKIVSVQIAVLAILEHAAIDCFRQAPIQHTRTLRARLVLSGRWHARPTKRQNGRDDVIVVIAVLRIGVGLPPHRVTKRFDGQGRMITSGQLAILPD